MKDALGVLYSRINGLTGFIILTWLLKNFRKNQFSSTYLLTINIHIPFETFYHFKYVVNETFMKVPVTQNDDTDSRFRKFKSYGPCAKNFDKKKGENQIFEEMFS